MIIGVNARMILSDNLEGIPRYIYETTREMALEHPNDRFILYFDRKIKHSLSFPDNVSFSVIPLQSRHPLLWIIWFEILLPYFLKRDKIDVFYSADGYMSLYSDIPTVLVTHDLAYIHYPEHLPIMTRWYYRYFTPRFFNAAKKIITVSDATRKDILMNHKINESKIEIAGNAINNYSIDNSGEIGLSIKKLVEHRTPYFCFIGALHPRKNVVKMCEAFAVFQKKYKKNYRLIIAGRFAWKSEDIKNSIQNNPMIEYAGTVNEAEKKTILSNSKGLLYLSLFEGFGIPILEGMLAGVPILCSDISSMPEVAGDAAIFADPTNIESMAEGMNEITKTDIKIKLIEAGKKRCMDFSWSKSASIIHGCISTCVPKKI
ncbi:MAG: glycosyltransferase family 4 protein [Saprospiraceae bacterium]|nr:glycosyltransferase family 4 protein [Saprospiraceae bacterium]